MTKKEFLQCFEVLKQESQNWNAPVVGLNSLTQKDPFKILFATILSLRTKDEVTKNASLRLFALATNAKTLAKIPLKTLESAIYPVGFYKNKSAQILEIARLINTKHKGVVPNSMDELLSFKGVGRKTANLVLSLAYNQDVICVDVHVNRIPNRMGLIKTKTPEETEFALMKLLPKNIWKDINNILVAFGQSICVPISPKCSICPISTKCKKIGVTKSR